MKSEMRKLALFSCTIICSFMSLCDMVQIDFAVRDCDGNPVEGVNIKCCTHKVPKIQYAKAESVCNNFVTDSDGKVSAKFECWDGYVNCYMNADGYYPEEFKDIIFNAPYEKRKDRYVFQETSKRLNISLRKIKNPVQMVFHRLFKTGKRLPAKSGRFGFDLEVGDWVAPNGKGGIADIYITYEWQEDDKNRTCTGAVEFVDKGCGAYIRKRHRCRLMPVDYKVEKNLSYKTYFPFSLNRNLLTGEYHETRIIADDEYLVVRSRAKVDVNGEILEANYSQIHGPVIIGRYFSLGDWFFNPRVNDLNLEYVQPR